MEIIDTDSIFLLVFHAWGQGLEVAVLFLLQVVERTFLDYYSILDHSDSIALLYSRESVGNNYRRSSLHYIQ